MTFRRWTAAELDALRACYATPTTTRMGHLPIADLARRLGRTYDACVTKAQQLGLTRSRHVAAEFEVTLRRLFLNGHSLREIARRLYMTDCSIKYALTNLGIAPTGKHKQTGDEKQRWRESIANFLHRAGGYESLRELTSEKELGEAMARWPVCTTRRQADVLDVLAEGPREALEIGARLGVGILRTRTLLRALRDLGAVRIVSRGVLRRVGRGSGPWVYAKMEWVERGKAVAEKASVAL